ncbi:uncharacterized protein BJ171DRAFT_580228 [Polychytrium aggregatum]|uniref:uncharacterized protein n=1 Tax=Polychytrium aggregatum TaxID=110093 RepID=UPI0022FE27BC|nr:uncharacterized protein BJ171DRAFT_580228 [Polychytrium aggregatum]KAI9206153.1 hypothetical protein BJ171DRAFT_580228 [Polychytrium aggregatum]
MTHSSTYQAVQFDQVGGPEVLKLVTIEKPAVTPGRVLIRNHFIGVNFIDTYHRGGLYKVQLPYIPGREASGVVEAVGDGVEGLKVGDRVAYFDPHTYAEYTLTSPAEVLVIPDDIGFHDAAGLLLQGLTALSLVRIAYEVKQGDIVLVHAAAGGTGRLIVALAKHYGATVIGTVSTPEKAEVARKAGADHIIFYKEQDIVAEVKRITNGEGVHAVFDGVGKTTFDASLASLRNLGFFLSFGNASGKIDDVDIFKLGPKSIRLMRPSLFSLIPAKDFKKYAPELLELYRQKAFDIYVSKIYPLKDAAQAHTDLAGGVTVGKLLLQA